MEDFDKLAVHAENPDLLRRFYDQHRINVPNRRRDIQGLGSSLIARAQFAARKRLEMSERPGFDMNSVQKESRTHFTDRKVWSA